jgi:uncharacterized RDD family membrane protein YckC
MGAAPWLGPPLAEYGQRVIAYLIDVAIVIALYLVVLIVGLILSAITRPLGVVVWILGYVAVFAYSVWNWGYLQGTTGQSIGKRQQGIRLIKEETLLSVGFGMAVVRYLVASVISTITCGIYGVLDLLWPLWDARRQRLTDKILKMNVVQGEKGPIDMNTLNPFRPRS